MQVQREVICYKRMNTFWKLLSGKLSKGLALVYLILAVAKPGGTGLCQTPGSGTQLPLATTEVISKSSPALVQLSLCPRKRALTVCHLSGH